jgi:hypothetical protein
VIWRGVRIALICLLVLPAWAWAVVVFDAADKGLEVQGPSATSPYTFVFTLGAGAKCVQVQALWSGDNPVISTVTVGATSLAVVSGSHADSGTMHAETWGGSTSLTGAQTVTISWTGGDALTFQGGAISATGCDVTTPVNNGNAVGDTASPVSLAITSASGDLTATAIYHNGTGNPATTNQTLKWNNTPVSNVGDGDIGPGTANPTHTWTTSGGDWVNAVVTGANFNQFIGGYILTEAGDCINGEDGSRLITEDVAAGVGPCVAVAGGPPLRTLMGVGQ